jgi:hypothetical protein
MCCNTSNQQVVRQKYYGMRLTVIDVTGRVLVHSSWAYFKNCPEFDVEANAGKARISGL